MPTAPLPLRHAARRLLRAPTFTIAAVLTLGIGLAATIAVFTLVRGVLLRPLPYPEPDRLVVLSHTLVVGGVLRADQSDATLLYYRRHNRAFARLGGYQSVAAAVSGERGTDAERVPAGRVTADLLPALGVLPLAGRVFSDADDRPGAAPVAVLSERLWARKYGRDPRVLHRVVTIDAVPREIVGIMPASLGFPTADTELWLPLGLDAAHTESATFDYHAVGRLRNGVTIEAAADDLQALLPQVPDEFPGRMTRGSIEQTRMRATVQRLAEVVEGDAAHLLWIVFGAAAFVLAIACANVANLFLVRAEQRQQGIAIQRALGATPRVVMAEFACEALLVAAGGGAIGVGGAAAAIQMLRSLEGVVDVPRLHELSLDTAVIGAAVAMTAAAALLITVVPAWRYAASTSPAPGAATQAATAGRNRHRARYTLIALQVALSLVLLVGSGLLARSMWRLRSVRPGFVPTHALTFRLTVPAVGYPDNEAAVRLYTNAVDAIAARPGVRHAAVVSKLPLDERGRIDSAVFVEDRPLAAGALPGIHPIVYATSDYFAAAGIPLVAGRTFARQDPPAVTLEAVVSSAFAERYWPGASPIGRRLRTLSGGPLYTIVGVAGDVRDAALDRPPEQMVYCPLLPPRQDRRWAPRDLAFVVRSDAASPSQADAMREAVRRLDRSLPIYRVATLADIVSHAQARRSFMLLLVAAAAAAAIALAAIGLYGVIAFVVTLRRREIGIRLAVGARPLEVRRLVWRQGIAVAAVGTGVGLCGAFAVSRALAAMLFEVSATDAVVFSTSAAFVLSVAAASSWLPARRASAVDPALTLRAE